jgi:hypothetical protein
MSDLCTVFNLKKNKKTFSRIDKNTMAVHATMMTRHYESGNVALTFVACPVILYSRSIERSKKHFRYLMLKLIHP